jgi:hypothetical protein
MDKAGSVRGNCVRNFRKNARAVEQSRGAEWKMVVPKSLKEAPVERPSNKDTKKSCESSTSGDSGLGVGKSTTKSMGWNVEDGWVID